MIGRFSNIGIIVNPEAGSAEQAQALRRLVARTTNIHFYELNGRATSEEVVARALADGCEAIAAAGGDGTVNRVVNSLVRCGADVPLGVIPLGTGNDLARTLAIGTDPLDAIAELVIGRVRRLDLMRVEAEGIVLYGINAAAGGIAGEVSEAITPEMKATYGPLAYIFGAVSALPYFNGYKLSIAIDDGSPEERSAVAVVVANCRTIAGGKRIAPAANPQDGLLDILVIHSESLLDLAQIGRRLVAGTLSESPNVLHRKARRLVVQSEPAMLFNVDGEVLTDASIAVEVVPAAIQVIVGAGYKEDVSGD